jgi:hypothetical protein
VSREPLPHGDYGESGLGAEGRMAQVPLRRCGMSGSWSSGDPAQQGRIVAASGVMPYTGRPVPPPVRSLIAALVAEIDRLRKEQT